MEIIWERNVVRDDDMFTLQLEDWSKDYPGTYSYGNMLAAYPKAKLDGETYFGPQRGHRFRCAFTFPDMEAANKAADAIICGAGLEQFADYMDRKDYLPCLTGIPNP